MATKSLPIASEPTDDCTSQWNAIKENCILVVDEEIATEPLFEDKSSTNKPCRLVRVKPGAPDAKVA